MEKRDFKKKKIRVIHPTKNEILKYFKEILSIFTNYKKNKNHILLEKKFKKKYILNM